MINRTSQLTVALFGLLMSAAAAFADAPPTSVQFDREIRPILSDNCYACHGPDAAHRKAKLRLDTKEGAFATLKKGGFAIVAGHLDQSELAKRISSADPDEQMPPPDSGHQLSARQIELIKRWIDQGATWAQHWSLVPPKRPDTPAVKTANWCRNPIDNFILARLEQNHLSPSPEATKETLIRRITLELSGLPPTPAEVDAFVADTSPDAYDKVVDRLMQSPHYGERMVWEWLDASRYADTNGYQGDSVRTMWPWRDWVINAMNKNMPFDQFTIEQLAGDLLPNATIENKIATGFCRNHMINGEGGRIAAENRVDYVMDQSETLSTVWLGLTVGCARCHDHKFDPITQKDYYSLFAFFNNTPVDGGGGSGQQPPVVDFNSPQEKQKLVDLQAEIEKYAAQITEMEMTLFPRSEKQMPAESPKAAKLSGNIINQLKRPPVKRDPDGLRELVNYYKDKEAPYAEALGKLKAAIEQRQQFNNNISRVMVMEEMPKPRDAFILTKGAYDKPTEKVTAETLSALPPLPPDAPHNRLALAKWLVSPDHPLTARVTVNRYWQQFFGVGLVKTVDDFGVQGEKPANAELLDFLASEFIRSGWNVKALHRLIVTSATYRQSSKMNPQLTELDPENRLNARGPRYRRPPFIIRDQALAASGLLVDQLGGPSVKPYQPPGVWEEATFGQIRYQQDHGQSLYRRSLYTFWRRIVGPTEFFDAGSRQSCTVRATRTNTPLHALTTLNDTTFVEAARVLAQRIMKEAGSPEQRIDLAYRLVLSRKPTAQEKPILLASLNRLESQYTKDKPAALKLLAVGESKRDEQLDPAQHAAYTGLCLAILNLDEAVTKE